MALRKNQFFLFDHNIPIFCFRRFQTELFEMMTRFRRKTHLEEFNRTSRRLGYSQYYSEGLQRWFATATLYTHFLVTEREELRILEITTRQSSDWSVSRVIGFSLHSRRIWKFIGIYAKPESYYVYRALIRSHTMLPPVIHRKKVFMYILNI